MLARYEKCIRYHLNHNTTLKTLLVVHGERIKEELEAGTAKVCGGGNAMLTHVLEKYLFYLW